MMLKIQLCITEINYTLNSIKMENSYFTFLKGLFWLKQKKNVQDQLISYMIN